ncbi:hypothetical protein [Acinetobacter modestus]|uniref:hypothetical protein n=1 Tax=Acinetobacter modestus TaxID=1776740 RepID=UPI001F4BB838|nr:hypothetical protein [Acinetobacter modestus]MCH7334686.1 hypothetical protein [Acinetobacter modestus]
MKKFIYIYFFFLLFLSVYAEEVVSEDAAASKDFQQDFIAAEYKSSITAGWNRAAEY